MTAPSDLREALRVPAQRLSGRYDPEELSFETTDEVAPLIAIFGQERAVRAIEFALGMEGNGYNLFAAGPDGLGKTAIVEGFLRERARRLPPPPDWIYVRNFEDPDRPIGIRMPAGEGRAFAEAMSEAVEHALVELAAAFESDAYARQRTELGQSADQRRSQLLEELSRAATEMGFQLQMTPSGIVSSPLIEGKPASDEVFEALPQERKDEIQQQAVELERVVQDAMLRVRGLERESQEAVEHLDEEVAEFAVEHLLAPLLERYAGDQELVEFLEAVRDDLRKERSRLREPQVVPQGAVLGAPPDAAGQQRQAIKRRYEVNVFVEHDGQRGAPVIVERHPTYYNLLGRVEYVGQFGTMVTDHAMIKAGSLARASGGYLVVRLRDVLQQPVAYDGLKRALTSEEVAIENLGESLGLVPTSALRPEPMPLDVRVAIVGEASLYGLLYRLDPDFRELFRVKADFETDFERTPANVHGVASLIRQQTEDGGLRPFTRRAVARVVEFTSRAVEDQRRMSANVTALVDLLRQADFWAGRDGSAVVEHDHVERALEEREYRSSLVRDRVQQMIDDGSIFIDTDGAEVGQINALSVYDLGDVMFGRPSRITCIASAGRGTIVNVERETAMAGRIYQKGFLISRGFLAHRFGQEKALSLHASLTFEQLYGDVDGDSASSTELYALLSALAQAPIDQGIAVTGSVNQMGDIQPIGGATAKIEGFYEVCLARGLTGRQGVMIPKTNIENVVLRPEVAAAIEDGRFHVWAVETISEGIEVLTGVPAGERGDDGRYTEDSMFRRVEDRLEQFHRVLAEHREFGGNDGAGAPPVRPPEPPPPPGVPPPPPPEPPVIV